MKRINIIGTTGSGKSALAKALSEQLNFPHVQMDQLFWKPNWQETPDEEFIPKLAEAISSDFWVLDGNYNRTNRIKWERVDTIVWIDYGYTRTLFQLLRRTISRASSQKELWPNTGNRESFRKSFMSTDSILIWFFRCFEKNRARYSELMHSENLSHVKMIRLRNPNEVEEFLQQAHNKQMQSDAAKAAPLI